MSCSVPTFWKLAQESGLLSDARRDELVATWRTMKGAARTSSSRTLAEWLVAEGTITRYHAKLLLAGQPGPFRFGGYLVMKRLRRGDLVDCFQAVHLPTQYPVTLRFVPGGVFDADTDVEEIRALFDSAWRSDRPSDRATPSRVAPFYEWVDCGAYQFAVFGRVEGGPLSEIVDQHGACDVESACRVMLQAARAIAAMHESGRSHGSLRSDTIWICASGSVDDRHLALDGDGDPPIALAGPVGEHGGEGTVCVLPPQLSDSWKTLQFGRPWRDATTDPKGLLAAAYTAPEAAARTARPTPASDVYSMGCLFYFLLTGRPPYWGTTTEEILQQHATEAVPPIFAQHDLGLEDSSGPSQTGRPPAEKLMQRMLAKDVATRPASAVEVADAVSELANLSGFDTTSIGYDAEHEARFLDLIKNDGFSDSNGASSSPPPIPFSEAATSSTPIPEFPVWTPDRPVAVSIAPLDKKQPAAQGGKPSRKRAVDIKLLVVGLLSAAIAAAGVWVLRWVFSEDRMPSANNAVNSDDGADPSVPNGARHTSQALWVSPTDGPPVSAAYLPEGTQGIFAIRLADLVAHPEGERVVASAGPRARELLSEVRESSGFEAAEIEQLIVGLAASGKGQTGTVMRLVRGASLEELKERLDGAEDATLAGESVVIRGDNVFFIPKQGNGHVVVITTVAVLPTVSDENAAPLFRREVERLRAASDADRHVTLIVPTSLLFGDGRDVVAAFAAPLAQPLEAFLGRDVRGVAVSGHWGEDFFVELAAVASVDVPPLELRTILDQRLREVPRLVEDHLLSLDLQPYGRRVVARLPEMLRRLSAYTRTASDAERAVARCYLPVSAGHNLVMASEIALAETRASVATGSPSAVPSPLSTRQRLSMVTSLSFSRDTLEAALETLAADVGVTIVIRGDDLEEEGITKNQSFSIDVQDRPARAILTEILRLANPDKTATSADDARQKLVFVVVANESGSETIYVTTRKAAAERGEELPIDFRGGE